MTDVDTDTSGFFDDPIINSPYEAPTRHHDLEGGRPTGRPPIEARRRSAYDTPVPGAKRARTSTGPTGDLLDEDTQYTENPIVNRIRDEVTAWRALPSPESWGVTPTTARLLEHWRKSEWDDLRPFFCQREAVETIVWMTEVARANKRYRWAWEHVEAGNEETNPGLLRLALKMATGAGKTTVMAMLIAWQTANAVRSPSSRRYAKGFLIIAPGITIRDRLRVLDPTDPDSYYEGRGLVPTELVGDVRQAKVVIQNYHAFQRRERTSLSKGTRGALEGWRGEAVTTQESEGEMLKRACGELLGMKGVVVINDEAHHCYRSHAGTAAIDELKGDDKKEAKANEESGKLWIGGIEALSRRSDVRGIYDLSATPFFLRGSGYGEGTLFPWVVSDFSLMDAIECGIVKLPRVPILDNMPETSDGKPIYRHLWEYIGRKLPKKGRGKTGAGSAAQLAQVPELVTALRSLYEHYRETFEAWERAGIEVPPVFIVVCNNTSTSQLVHDWIAGYEVSETDEEAGYTEKANLPLFANYDPHGRRLPVPQTLLIDSVRIDSGEALDKPFRDAMAPEIERFRQERARREGAGAGDIGDEELLREVMNTVGEKGRLGEKIRCVVSVSMLTEGWDTNTVTHILGVRAFGTQLLCEQVVGRGLRRQSYELQENGLLKPEYADILGIPFDFVAKPTKAPPTPPQNVTKVRALREREALMITFPNVTGYRSVRPGDRIRVAFDGSHDFTITPKLIGPSQTTLAGVQGEQVTIGPTPLGEETRSSTIVFHLAKHITETRFSGAGGGFDGDAFMKVKTAVSRWLDEGRLHREGEGTFDAMVTWPGIIDKAVERIFAGLEREGYEGEPLVSVIVDPFNPTGSTRHVAFNTVKRCYATDPRKSHVSHVVEDSSWEAELARVAEAHPRVLAYVKNQGLGFEVPWRDGAEVRRYLPDFLVRIDDGRGADDPLVLIVEIKGRRDDDAVQKARTMRDFWVPGVNALGAHGRWAFAEFTSVYEIESEFGALVDGFVQASAAGSSDAA